MRALLWDAQADGSVHCRLCAQACRIRKGGKGLCGVRYNVNGSLITLVGDVVTSATLDPVEKKPLYHFLPGSRTFSVGSAGCNFACQFCQNHDISVIPADGRVPGKRVRAEELVRQAEKLKARSLAFTYNEPTVFFELVYESAGLAQNMGLPCILVSNGYMSQDCLVALSRRIKAANIDLKAFSDNFYHQYCNGRLQPVLDNLKRIKALGWWLEVTTLIIPDVNDSPAELHDLATFIRDELGPDTPWHVSAFHGAHKMLHHPSTSPDRLEDAWRIGREAGLHFVYMGNVLSSVGSTTFCPSCGAPVMERRGHEFRPLGQGGACPSCKTVLAGVWK